MIITLQWKTLENGCVAIDCGDLIKAANECAAPRKGCRRGAFPRYILKCDGERVETSNVRRLLKELQTIRAGSKCRVFRNAGYGATIDFDFED